MTVGDDDRRRTFVVKQPAGARPLPDSLRAGRFVVQVRDPAADPVLRVGHLPGGRNVFVLDPAAVDMVPMLPRREAAAWYGVPLATLKRWCRKDRNGEAVVYSSIGEDGRLWVACPWGADSTDWPEVTRYLLGRLGRDELRRALGKHLGDAKRGNSGEHSDAGNTHLHAWARGDVTPNRRHQEQLRRLFVREKYREAVGR